MCLHTADCTAGQGVDKQDPSSAAVFRVTFVQHVAVVEAQDSEVWLQSARTPEETSDEMADTSDDSSPGSTSAELMAVDSDTLQELMSNSSGDFLMFGSEAEATSSPDEMSSSSDETSGTTSSEPGDSGQQAAAVESSEWTSASAWSTASEWDTASDTSGSIGGAEAAPVALVQRAAASAGATEPAAAGLAEEEGEDSEWTTTEGSAGSPEDKAPTAGEAAAGKAADQTVLSEQAAEMPADTAASAEQHGLPALPSEDGEMTPADAVHKGPLLSCPQTHSRQHQSRMVSS